MNRTYFAIAPPGDELYHFGVKGMKWGIRRYHNDYNRGERKIDKSMYGGGGVKRINKRMLRGVAMNDARAIESRRLYRARKAANNGEVMGRFIGAIAGAAGGIYLSGKLRNKMMSSERVKDFIGPAGKGLAEGFKRFGRRQLAGRVADVTANRLAYVPAVYVGQKIGARIGKRLTMRRYGYSPKYYR